MNDLLIAPVWLIINGLLFWGCWKLSHRLFSTDQWFQHLGHTILMGYAIIVLVGTSIGSVGLLFWWLYLLLVGILSLLLMIYLHRTTPSIISTSAQSKTWEDQIWFIVWTLLICFWVGHIVLNGFLHLPTDWDSLMYHLPFVDHWLQDHHLYSPNCLRWSDPGNNELFALWIVAPFSGDFLYSLNNLPAAILLACGALEIGRWLGLSRMLQNLAALAIATIGIVLNQLQTVENDVATVGLFLTSLGYIFRFSAQGNRWDLLLGVTALGLLAGIKFYALGYAFVVGLVALFLLLSNRGWKVTLQATLVALIGVSIFGGYWYLRNFLVSGAPLYPLGAKGSAEDLDQTYPAFWQSTFIGNGSPELWDLATKAIWYRTGPCHWAAFFAFPWIVIWLLPSGFVQFSRRNGTEARGNRLALLLGTLTAFAILMVTPFAIEDVPGTLNQLRWGYCPVRYGLCFLSLTVLCAAVGLSDLAKGMQSLPNRFASRRLPVAWINRLNWLLMRSIGLGLVMMIAYQWQHQIADNPISLYDSLLMGVVLFLVGMNLRLLFPFDQRFRRFYPILTNVLLIGAFTLGIDYLSIRWHQNYVSYYDRWLSGGVFGYLQDHCSSQTPICVLDRRSYPFFGSKRQFRVLQVPPSKTPAWWEQFVQTSGIQLIAARFSKQIDHRDWHVIEPWFFERKDLFEEIRDQPWVHTIFLVRDRTSFDPELKLP